MASSPAVSDCCIAASMRRFVSLPAPSDTDLVARSWYRRSLRCLAFAHNCLLISDECESITVKVTSVQTSNKIYRPRNVCFRRITGPRTLGFEVHLAFRKTRWKNVDPTLFGGVRRAEIWYTETKSKGRSRSWRSVTMGWEKGMWDKGMCSAEVRFQDGYHILIASKAALNKHQFVFYIWLPRPQLEIDALLPVCGCLSCCRHQVILTS